MTLTTPSDRVSALVFWTRVDTGLWVALRAGQHLGRVDAVDATRFDAYSRRGQRLSAHATLRDAQHAVETQV